MQQIITANATVILLAGVVVGVIITVRDVGIGQNTNQETPLPVIHRVGTAEG